jgi:hypothetical protein
VYFKSVLLTMHGNDVNMCRHACMDITPIALGMHIFSVLLQTDACLLYSHDSRISRPPSTVEIKIYGNHLFYFSVSLRINMGARMVSLIS